MEASFRYPIVSVTSVTEPVFRTNLFGLAHFSLIYSLGEDFILFSAFYKKLKIFAKVLAI